MLEWAWLAETALSVGAPAPTPTNRCRMSHTSGGFLACAGQGSQLSGTVSRTRPQLPRFESRQSGISRRLGSFRDQAAPLLCGGPVARFLGAVVRGGEAARHSSTKAANLLWQKLHPDAELQAVDWDLFHRVDIVGHRAGQATPMVMEVNEVSRSVSALFGPQSAQRIACTAPTLNRAAHARPGRWMACKQ